MYSFERVGRVARAAIATLMTSGVLITVCVRTAIAQEPATVTGTVTAADGAPIADATVVARANGKTVRTDSRGSFALAGLPAGELAIAAEKIGYAGVEQRVQVRAGERAELRLVLAEQAIELTGVVVTATRETRLKSRTPAAVGTVGSAEIRAIRPRHPGEIVSQIAGVWVAQTSGEGHTTAIRQPKSTKPMYLFLEDGVPTRSTGFFNHNALYEVNVPQAERIEVLKGPGTALYGSDAVGGVINVETRRASLAPQLEGSYEGGSNGWSRVLLSGSSTLGDHGLRADLNVTRSDGFRTATAYDRASGTIRWDGYLPGNATLRTVASYTTVDQVDGSSLTADDYRRDPALNYNPIAFRKVRAFRLSSALEVPVRNGLVSLTPFVRENAMEILPSWMLAFDPVVYETGHRSAGLLARVRYDLPFWSGEVIGGVDVEHSPGYRQESTIRPSRLGRAYVGYEQADQVYDYDVTFQGVSPYLQTELSPLPRLRLSLGGRYDRVGYDYHTRLAPTATGRWRRPADGSVRYEQLSPKAGLTLDVAPELNLFASYRHGFRAPAEGQLFRQGSSAGGVELRPVRTDSYEGGVRGTIGRLSYDIAAYRMEIEDDILTYVAREGNAFNRVNVNAGETRHLGIEVGAGARLASGIRVGGSYTNALHTYESWAPSAAESFAGNRIESAPREIASLRLTYHPSFAREARVGLEWTRIGSYFMDPANLHRYPGHSLVNLRLGVPLTRGLGVDASVTNLLDERYAESAAYNAAEGETFTPGAPRSLSVAVRYRWER